MKKKRPAKAGTRLSPNLTVLGVIDGGSIDPVYIVWNDRTWCPMACKVFSSSVRAEREAAILDTFAHPNIVRLLGLEAPVHMLMPFLDGPSLSHMIRTAPQKRLSADNALRLAVHIGAALIHVHDKGYLHLDVKPSNVIIAAGGNPVLFDFGTARRRNEPRPKGIAGTDQYLAPEEATLQSATPANDIFSFGVTLFEMLTGELPFLKRSKLKPFPQIEGEPRSLRKLRPGLPKRLYDIVEQCLRRDPHSRPELTSILPELNSLIRSGPKMWPEGFEPRHKKAARALPFETAETAAPTVRYLL